MISWGSYVHSILSGFRSPFEWLPLNATNRRHLPNKKPGSLTSPGFVQQSSRLLSRDEVGLGQQGLADLTAQGLDLLRRDGRSGVAEAVADVGQYGGDLFVGLMR